MWGQWKWIRPKRIELDYFGIFEHIWPRWVLRRFTKKLFMNWYFLVEGDWTIKVLNLTKKCQNLKKIGMLDNSQFFLHLILCSPVHITIFYIHFYSHFKVWWFLYFVLPFGRHIYIPLSCLIPFHNSATSIRTEKKKICVRNERVLNIFECMSNWSLG